MTVHEPLQRHRQDNHKPSCTYRGGHPHTRLDSNAHHTTSASVCSLHVVLMDSSWLATPIPLPLPKTRCVRHRRDAHCSHIEIRILCQNQTVPKKKDTSQHTHDHPPKALSRQVAVWARHTR
jgi:hypothetical protein